MNPEELKIIVNGVIEVSANLCFAWLGVTFVSGMWTSIATRKMTKQVSKF